MTNFRKPGNFSTKTFFRFTVFYQNFSKNLLFLKLASAMNIRSTIQSLAALSLWKAENAVIGYEGNGEMATVL